jgi:hypothetical protein
MPITCPDCCDAKDSCSPRASPIFRDKKRYVPDKACGWRASVPSIGGTSDRSTIERQPRSRRRPPLRNKKVRLTRGAVCSIAAHSRASQKSRRTRKTGQRLRPVIHIDFYPHQASALNAPKQSFVASNIF